MKIKTINAEDLICMDNYAEEHNFRVDLAYASSGNLLFGERIYREGSKLWLHKDLAKITLRAAEICFEKHDLHFVLYDGLRTIEAQSAMMETRRVKDNPHWLEEPRLLSPAGTGGHPRGMAIDIGLENSEGELIDMGCAFDYLAEDPTAEHNPAHRKYNHPQNIVNNRKILDDCMNRSAQLLNIDIVMLAEEWWDFRIPADIYNRYAPLSDAELPEHIRLTDI